MKKLQKLYTPEQIAMIIFKAPFDLAQKRKMIELLPEFKEDDLIEFIGLLKEVTKKAKLALLKYKTNRKKYKKAFIHDILTEAKEKGAPVDENLLKSFVEKTPMN